MPGEFITLEGIEGVGKSTNVEFVAEFLRDRGVPVLVTREPGGTPLGEQIRHWLLQSNRDSVLPVSVEVLLMFTARAAHLEQVIRPALAAGQWVVCDRFTDATFAYQGGGGGADPELLRTLRANVQRGLEPRLTLLLDASPKLSADRIRGRIADYFERRDHTYFERVRGEYLRLATCERQRIRVIDATAPLVDVQRQIEGHLATLVANRAA